MIKHVETALQHAMHATMTRSSNNIRIAEAISKISTEASKMNLSQVTEHLRTELEKWESKISTRKHNDCGIERAVLQYVKELLFLVNNLMQAPTAVHERERFRNQLKVAKKIFKNSKEPFPRIILWSVEAVEGRGKKISMLGIEGSTYVY